MRTQERQVLVHLRIELGELPEPIERVRLWAGSGSQRPCEICGETIAASDVEYELDVDERTLVLCVPCYLIWRANPPAA
jgi:hypothetical protein